MVMKDMIAILNITTVVNYGRFSKCRPCVRSHQPCSLFFVGPVPVHRRHWPPLARDFDPLRSLILQVWRMLAGPN